MSEPGTNVVRLTTSRTFLIRQAVLNAAVSFYPWGVEHMGAPAVLRRVEAANLLGAFAIAVMDEYQKLTRKYSEAPEPVGDCAFTDDELAFAADLEAAGAGGLL